MPMLNFGQPANGVIQTAYVVEDIARAMRDFTQRLGVGPWFVSGPFVPAKGLYRGQPTDMRLTLAVAFAGHMMLEVIEQHDDKPSVYCEMIDTRGYGFHHWARPSADLDRDIAAYQAQGYEVAFSDVSPRGARIAYIDTLRDLPGMVELIEMSERLEAIYTRMYQASVGWDGTDPVRPA
jgi:hypothetical protein